MIKWFFLGKILFWSFLGIKGPKMKFFKSHEKSMHGIFLLFCMKLQQRQDLKLTQMIFSWKILSEFFWAKSGWNEFFEFYNSLMGWVFLNFFHEVIMAKNPKKWAQKEVFQVLWRTEVIDIPNFLHKVTSAYRLEIALNSCCCCCCFSIFIFCGDGHLVLDISDRNHLN